MRLKSLPVPDAEDIQISFSRSLPVNEMEVAQMVRTLSGLVPEEVLNMQKQKNYTPKSLYSQLPKGKPQKLNQFNARAYLTKRTLQYIDLIGETLYNDLLINPEKNNGTRQR